MAMLNNQRVIFLIYQWAMFHHVPLEHPKIFRKIPKINPSVLDPIVINPIN
jgi:hypothetical protein